jgi:hypothetical protein
VKRPIGGSRHLVVEDCDSLHFLVGKSKIWLVTSHRVLAKIGAALPGSVAGTSTYAYDFSLVIRVRSRFRCRTE